MVTHFLNETFIFWYSYFDIQIFYIFIFTYLLEKEMSFHKKENIAANIILCKISLLQSLKL